MSEFKNNDFADVLLNRHSVRNFDPSVEIPMSELRQMIKEATTAPSSGNMQAWQFAVISSPAEKAKLKDLYVGPDLNQVGSASALVIVFANKASYKRQKAMLEKQIAAGEGNLKLAQMTLKAVIPYYESADDTYRQIDATIAASMAAMQLLLIARAHGYDAGPMLGLKDPAAAATAMGLDPADFVPVMTIALGKSNGSPEMTTTRYDLDTVATFK